MYFPPYTSNYLLNPTYVLMLCHSQWNTCHRSQLYTSAAASSFLQLYLKPASHGSFLRSLFQMLLGRPLPLCCGHSVATVVLACQCCIHLSACVQAKLTTDLECLSWKNERFSVQETATGQNSNAHTVNKKLYLHNSENARFSRDNNTSILSHTQ